MIPMVQGKDGKFEVLVELQEVIVLLVDVELGIVAADTGDHLLDAGRLTALIGIAEKGESESVIFHHTS